VHQTSWVLHTIRKKDLKKFCSSMFGGSSEEYKVPEDHDEVHHSLDLAFKILAPIISRGLAELEKEQFSASPSETVQSSEEKSVEQNLPKRRKRRCILRRKLFISTKNNDSSSKSSACSSSSQKSSTSVCSSQSSHYVYKHQEYCLFYNTKKGCKFGDNCHYAHVKGRRPVCKFYHSRLGCRYGDKCMFYHSRPKKLVDVATNTDIETDSGKNSSELDQLLSCCNCNSSFFESDNEDSCWKWK